MTAAKPSGRPRSFDLDQALDQAMQVFWQKGYEGASLPDLTEAMGINRPSLYAAFGNKEGLFRQVLDRYATRMTGMQAALALPKARQVAEKYLYSVIEALTTSGSRGCLMVQGALVCSDAATTIKAELTTRRSANEKALRERLERAQGRGRSAGRCQPRKLGSLHRHGFARDRHPGRQRRQRLRTTAGSGIGPEGLAYLRARSIFLPFAADLAYGGSLLPSGTCCVSAIE